MTKTSGETNDVNGGAAEETKKEDEEEEKDASLLEMKSMLMDTHISDGSGKKKSYWAVSMETMGYVINCVNKGPGSTSLPPHNTSTSNYSYYGEAAP